VLIFAKCITIMIVVLAVTSGWDPLLTKWFGWDGFDLACVEPYDL
jgi:hypothetical protein